MAAAAWGVVLSAAAFLVHVMVWRIARPRASAAALLGIVLAVLLAGLSALGLLTSPGIQPTHWTTYAGIALVYFALMAAYINTYPAMEADSPSLLIMRALSAADNGLSVPELTHLLGNDAVVTDRIRDLIAEHYAVTSGGKLVLTAKGRGLAWIFHAYRKLIGRGLGG